jgi:hypothetical protein
MGTVWLSVVILIAGAIVGWVVAMVFRGGAPTGESSSRADTFASGPGIGADDADTFRHKQTRERTDA